MDLSGERATLVCNLEPVTREIPLAPVQASLSLALFGADEGVERPIAEISPERTSVALGGPCGALYIGGTRP